MDSKDGTQSESQIRSSELVSLQAKFEKYCANEQERIDRLVAEESYAHAEYHKGKQHAYALASLEVKRLLQANAKLSD